MWIKTSLRNPLPPAVKCSPKCGVQDYSSRSYRVDAQSTVSKFRFRFIGFHAEWVIFQRTISTSLLFKNKHVRKREREKKEDIFEGACRDNLVISNNHNLLWKNARYLLFSLVDSQEKHELRQKHGRCCV